MEIKLADIPEESLDLLTEILKSFSGKRVLVYGGILREYLYRTVHGKSEEISEDLDILLFDDDFDACVSKLTSITRALFPALIKERTIRLVGRGNTTADVTIYPVNTDLSTYPFDFTVNSFYCDARELVEGGAAKIETPFDSSWDDIRDGILRAPSGDVLVEHNFGAIRGLRLFSQLGFRFSSETLKYYPLALKRASVELSPLLIVREFMKAIEHSAKRFAVALVLTKGDRIFFSPLDRLLEKDDEHHVISVCGNYDELRHSERADSKFWERWQGKRHQIIKDLENVKMGVSKQRNLLNLVGISALLHDIGKAVSNDDHTVVGSDVVGRITDRLGFFPSERFFIYLAVSAHHRVHEAAKGNEADIQWFKEQRPLIRSALVLLGLADRLAYPYSDDEVLSYLQLLSE